MAVAPSSRAASRPIRVLSIAGSEAPIICCHRLCEWHQVDLTQTTFGNTFTSAGHFACQLEGQGVNHSVKRCLQINHLREFDLKLRLSLRMQEFVLSKLVQTQLL